MCVCYPQKWGYNLPTMCSHMCQELFHLIRITNISVAELLPFISYGKSWVALY